MVERYDANKEDGGISPLRRRREECGVTQEAMAKAIGVSVETYRRLERGAIDDPGVRVLHNCALALGTSLYNILPKKWYAWTQFSEAGAKPPWWGDLFDLTREGANEQLSTELPDELLAVMPNLAEQNEGLFGPK